MARDSKQEQFWRENPDWFTSFHDDPQNAQRVIAAALQVVVEARPSLTHWWCYQPNRDMDQKNPQRFDLDAKRTPNLVRLVVEANRQLQMQTMGFTYATSPTVVLPSVGVPTPPGTSQPSAR